MEWLKRSWQRTPSPIRKTLVLAVGSLVIVAGMIMWVIPGPGWLTVFIGLAILATEFERAQRLKAWAEHQFKQLAEAARERARQHKKTRKK